MKGKINSKAYWKWRNRRRNVEFRFRKLIFKTNRFTNEIKSSTRTNINLIRNILADIVKAFLFVVILLVSEAVIEDKVRLILSLSQLNVIAKVLEFEKSTFVLLVSTLASITGVFLGLYFSSIGNIVGSIYAKLPKELSLIFENEKIGNKYIRSLMRFIIVCLILLISISIGIETGYITSLIVTFYGCISIMNFFNLGKLIYKYSDIVEVSNSITEKVIQNIELATVDGVAWDDSNFQHHYYKNCSEQLRLLEILGRTIIESDDKSERNDSLVKVFNKSFSLLYNYQVHYKGKIPSDSMWFAKKPQHKSWFAEDFSALETAINTSGFINPKYVVNEMWFEERIFKIISSVINELLERKDFNRVTSVLNIVAEYSEVLVSNFEVKNMITELNSITSRVHNTLLDDSVVISNKMDNIDDKIGCIETITGLYTGVVIGITKKVDKFSTVEFDKFVDNKAWENEAAIHGLMIPHALIKRIEDLRKKLEFENIVEGNTISSNWYIKQLLSLEYARVIEQITEELVEMFNNQFVKPCVDYHEKKKFIASYIHVYQGVTCYDRVMRLIAQLESKYNDIERLRVDKDIPWVDIDFAIASEKLKSNYSKLIETMGESILVFAFQRRNDEFPDFFGHGYSYLYQACFEALFDEDFELFKKLYSLVIKVTLAADYKIKMDLKGVTNDEYMNLMVINSSFDFMTLSGHAIFFSELISEPSLKDFIISESDKVFSIIEPVNNITIYERFLIIFELEDNTIGIHSRGIIRTSWQQQMARYAMESGLIKEEYGERFYHEKKVIHPSPLIRSFSYDIHFSVEFAELYVCLYLNDKVAEEKRYKTRWGWEDRYLENLNAESGEGDE